MQVLVAEFQVPIVEQSPPVESLEIVYANASLVEITPTRTTSANKNKIFKCVFVDYLLY